MTMKYKGSSRVRKHKHTHKKKESINTKEKLVTVTKVLKNFLKITLRGSTVCKWAQRTFSKVMKMFYIVIVVTVKQMHTFVKTQNIHLRWVYYTEC